MYASWPQFSQDEIDAVNDVLSSGKVNYWTGDQGRLFEKEFANYVGCEYAIAVANGTVALELALYSLDIGPGDDVIVPSRTFIATASSVVMRGATPILADVDPISQNITLESIEAALTPNTKAIIVVHLAGWPCDMDAIMEFARERKLFVIEDCAQAHGAKYKGRSVGSMGHMAAFSFCQDKIMTTGGEGGMVTTSDKSLWEKAWSFKDHGKSYDAVYNREHPAGFRWLHESFGTNWRLSEMQSAIGRAQLKKLDDWVARRCANATILTEHFSRFPALRLTLPPAHSEHSYYKYYVFIRPELLGEGWNRDRIIEDINSAGVPCYSGSCSEIYLEKAFLLKDFQPESRLEVARELGETSLMFLVHPTLGLDDMNKFCHSVEQIFNAVSMRQLATLI